MRRSNRLLVVVSAVVVSVFMPVAAEAATGPIELGMLPDDEYSNVTAVGDRGHAAVKWTATGQMIELAWPNSNTTTVNAINNAGDGYDDAGKQVPVRWVSDGSVTVLPRYRGGRDGTIAGGGMAADSRYHAACWPVG